MGYYVKAYKEINTIEIQKAALIRIKQKSLIDENKYKILSTGVFENYRPAKDADPFDAFQVIACDMQACDCGEPTRKMFMYNLKTDLAISPEYMVDYYLYRFSTGAGAKRGRAIRVVKGDETDSDRFAYNAILIDMNIKQIAYVMIPSHGPEHRILTARQAYTHKVKVYLYANPDSLPDTDNFNTGYDEALIR